MAELADVVKGLHKKLRQDMKAANGDYDKVWKDHCSDKDTLQKYATAMHSLAINQWSKNSPGGRADWCIRTCQEYFKEGGLKAAIDKQKRRIDKEMGTVCCCCLNADLIKLCTSLKGDKFNLLDVGSCYNPFTEFQEFSSIAIDLHPATETVYKCDILDLKINSETDQRTRQHHDKAVSCSCRNNSLPQPTYSNDNEEQAVISDNSTLVTGITQKATDITTFLQKPVISELPSGYFHVVVFSLLLSYFPSPIQRWDCCIKAHKLLAVNGILIVITPDSSHQNRNAAMVKSWKAAIESIGFVRWRYVKDTHVHCMVFRKVSPCHHSCSKACSCAVSVNVTPEMLYIRQDFQDDEQEESSIDDTNKHGGEESCPVSKKRKIESEFTQ